MSSIKIIFGIDDVFFFPKYKEYFENLISFLSSHPKLKATFFTVADYQFKQNNYFLKLLGKRFGFPLPAYSPNTYKLSDNTLFTKDIKRLINKGQIEIAGHGFSHVGSSAFPAREFIDINKEKTLQKLSGILKEFEDCHFPKPVGFSSPGWEYNPILLKMLKKTGFSYVAGSFDSGTPISKEVLSHQAGIKNVPLLSPFKLSSGLINVPRNVTLDEDGLRRAGEIAKINGIVSIHAHLYPIGVNNSMSKQNLIRLKRIIDALADRYNLDFCLFKNVSEDYLKRN